MSDELLALTHPELVVGIAGAIGVDIDAISEELTTALQDVGYMSVPIRVTDAMMEFPADGVVQDGEDFYSSMQFKMNYANKLCEAFEDPATLMRIAMRAISIHREENCEEAEQDESDARGVEEVDDEALLLRPQAVLPRTAYIIRQLKRPEEVRLLRKTYGKQFILVSAYGSYERRKENIINQIKKTLPVSTEAHAVLDKAEKLISRDADEGSYDYGQHLRDTFHLADVFVDGINRDAMRPGIARFLQAFFGKADIGPSKYEYGMYVAKSASLRSCDLSRQVGAAIFSVDGEVISQGCNEVPKAFGGTYWDGEEPDHRDVKKGYDPNDEVKKEVIKDFFERLEKADLIDISSYTWDNFFDAIFGLSESRADEKFHSCLRGSQIADLTEYGRVVHAEMSAICDSARLGKSVKGAILFCSTFPCHNCTKHILAAGISKVIYMEPYPKSRAKSLHSDEIEIEKASETRVSFIPFLGISPFRYRDIFEKRGRKEGGQAKIWYNNHPQPMIDVAAPAYLDVEYLEIGKLGGSIEQGGSPATQEP